MKLEPIDAVSPSTYNPRSADAARLDLVALSLRKLGWLLPVYATPEGEILSGHQRHLVAGRLGLKVVPVVRVSSMDLLERKTVNIMFNRGTNDLQSHHTPGMLTRRLQQIEVEALAAALPDIDPDSQRFHRCMHSRPVKIAELVAANGDWQDYAATISGQLRRKGIHMPVIVSPGMEIVNGAGRVQAAAEAGDTEIRVVELDDDEVPFARAMLNLLSMDFDLHNRYADLLRHNSFRRSVGQRSALGRGMLWAMLGSKTVSLDFDINRDDHREAWLGFYGQPVLDFGAGRFDEVHLLRSAGIDADGFEPYCLAGNSNDIDPALSRQRAAEFLDRVAAGVQWRSIFKSAIFNSVPFEADRRHIVAILAALCDHRTVLYTYASSVRGSNIKERASGQAMRRSGARSSAFMLDYEDNTSIGIMDKPKVQKYFTTREFASYFRPFFREVVATYGSSGIVTATVRSVKAVDVPALRAALEHEFDLPYPDESRMGMSSEAKAAFGERLGVRL